MEIIITTLVAGIGGAILGAYCTYLGAVRISKTNERQQANVEFYRVMSIPLVRLEREPDTSPFHAASNAHEQIVAATHFRYYLRGSERKRFDVAWKEYWGEYRPENVNSYFPHMYSPENESKQSEIKELFLTRLHALLEFTGYAFQKRNTPAPRACAETY